MFTQALKKALWIWGFWTEQIVRQRETMIMGILPAKQLNNEDFLSGPAITLLLQVELQRTLCLTGIMVTNMSQKTHMAIG